MENNREKLYVFLLAGLQFCHILDFVVMMPLGPLLMNDFGLSPIQFAGLVSSYNYAAAISGLCFGTIADRFDRKRLLFFALAGFIIGTLSCGLIFWRGQLLIARIVTGCFGGILNALVLAIVTDLVPYERRGKAMGSVMSAFSVASVLGVPIGLTIADFYGWKMTFIFIAAISLVIAIIAQSVFPAMQAHILVQTPREAIKRYGKLLVKGHYLEAHTFIFIVAMSTFLLIPFLSPYAVKNIGIATQDLKYMYLIGGGCTVLTARLVGKLTDRWGALKTYWILAGLSSIPIFWFTHSGPMAFLTYVLLSTCFMTIISGRMIPCMTLISGVPDNQDRGSFMGVLGSIRSLGSATSTLVAGFIITEATNGKLLGFDNTGYLSLGLMALSLYLAYRIQHRLSAQEI